MSVVIDKALYNDDMFLLISSLSSIYLAYNADEEYEIIKKYKEEYNTLKLEIKNSKEMIIK